MAIDSQTKVGDLAVAHPLATRVFARRGIDFCCGGARPLSEVCAEKGVSFDQVRMEVETEISQGSEAGLHWEAEPLGALIDHIVRVYHEPLKEELPRLEAMARKVNMVHGPKDPERLQAIQDAVVRIRADLDPHLQKEEEILFPMIRDREQAEDPISVMEMEHEEVGAMLRRLRELTRDYEVPAGACNTWRALWVGLEDLERALHEHIHLENNILHKRARAG